MYCRTRAKAAREAPLVLHQAHNQSAGGFETRPYRGRRSGDRASAQLAATYDRDMSIPLTSLEPIGGALRQAPFGLLCDVDGTLSPMAPTPAEAHVTPRNLNLIKALNGEILVAVVSGRDLPDLCRMLATPSLVYVGLHGLAWLVGGHEQLLPEAEPYRAHTQQASEELRGLRATAGVFVEVKTVGLAFHYRGAGDPAATRAAILQAISRSPAATRFQVHEGIRMVELRPPIVSNKGFAVRRLVERFDLRGLLYLGDDVTDVDAFREARRLREAGSVVAYGVAVTHAEAPPAAADAADFTVADVGGVEWLLGEIAKTARTED